MINEIKSAVKSVQTSGWSKYPSQEVTYKMLRYLLDELEKANTENERIQLVSNDWQDEYESVNRRLIELDRSSGETLDLLRKSSRTIITKDAEIFDLRTEHTAMKEALQKIHDSFNPNKTKSYSPAAVWGVAHDALSTLADV